MKPQCRHTKDVLPNGLRLVTVELPHLHTAAIVVYAKVGSRYESPQDNGLSHFLEHMLFRGSEGHPSSFALNLAIESLGGTLYAETGRDYSLYQISLWPDLLSEGMAILADIFSAPAFTQIELERQIVLEEINEDLDENGVDVSLDDLARRTAFPDHPLGQKITGPAANVERFTVADCRRHFARFYGAENLILCVSGPVRREEVLAAATRLTGRIPRGAQAESVTPAEPSGAARFAYVENPGAQTAVQVLFRALPEVHPDFVTLQTLLRVLDDGMSTRLHYTLCDQMGLAYYVNGALEPFHDAALVVVDGAAAHAKLGELLDRMLAILGRFRDEPVSPDELLKAKRRYRYDLAAAFDDADAMAGWFGGTELFYAPAEFDTKVARMDAVTAADIQRVAQEIFRRERLVVAASGALAPRQLGKVKRIVEEWG
ncbi:MAG TPA: pitrilysin family protein [Haliangiales bacterium]|nr:pitrilysin family protein [Haliangiales bacterium]